MTSDFWPSATVWLQNLKRADSMTKARDVFAPIWLTWFSMQIKYFMSFWVQIFRFMNMSIFIHEFITVPRNEFMQWRMLMANCPKIFHKVLSNQSDTGFTFYQFSSMWNNIYDQLGFCFFKFHVWFYAKVKILIQLEL